MALKMSKNLIEAMEKNKRLALDKEKSKEPRLIINMGKKTEPSLEEITEYVKQHTSGKRYHYDLAEGGSIIVSFKEFVKMISDGYNIYKSEVLNENYISIQYQKEVKREGRGR